MTMSLSDVQVILSRVRPEIPWSLQNEGAEDFIGVVVLIWKGGIPVPYAGAKFYLDGGHVACQFTTRPHGLIPAGEAVATFHHAGSDYVWPAINLPMADTPDAVVAQALAVVGGFDQIIQKFDTPSLDEA